MPDNLKKDGENTMNRINEQRRSFKEIETKWELIFNIRKIELHFQGYIISKESFENVIHTGYIEGKSGGGRPT